MIKPFLGLAAIAIGILFIFAAAKIHKTTQPNREHYRLPDGETSFDDGDIPGMLVFLGALSLLMGLAVISTALCRIA